MNSQCKMTNAFSISTLQQEERKISASNLQFIVYAISALKVKYLHCQRCIIATLNHEHYVLSNSVNCMYLQIYIYIKFIQSKRIFYINKG